MASAPKHVTLARVDTDHHKDGQRYVDRNEDDGDDGGDTADGLNLA